MPLNPMLFNCSPAIHTIAGCRVDALLHNAHLYAWFISVAATAPITFAPRAPAAVAAAAAVAVSVLDTHERVFGLVRKASPSKVC